MSTGQQPRTPQRTSRVRRILPLGIVVWLALDIWLLSLLGQAAGGFTVLLVIAASFVAGAMVVKAAGRRTSRRWAAMASMLQQRPPGSGAPEETDSGHNGFLLLGGVLLMIPGLISDAAGLLLLVPRVRSALAAYTERSLRRSLERQMSEAGHGGFEDLLQQAQRGRMRQDGTVVQGEVVRDDKPARPRGQGDDDGPRPPLTR